MSKMRKLFKFLRNYKNYFDLKNVKTFFEYENKNYIINFIFDAKSLYKSLYILFKIEFDILKDYLLNILILNYIKELTICANTSIFFVFKKNNNFRFYMDYKELNTSRAQYKNITRFFKASISQRETYSIKILIFIYNELVHYCRSRRLFTQ